MKASVAVVGGAGYIGSHAVKALARAGYRVTVIDNLSRGWREAVKWGELVVADLADRAALAGIFTPGRFDAVMDFAAFAYVGESVQKPALYYRNNVMNTLNLLEAMTAAGCDKIIFSSTCAVYGEPQALPLTEEHPHNPVNPYGWTKMMVERMMCDMAVRGDLAYVALRYFNAAGADPEGEIGERHEPETHLIPLAVYAALGRTGPLSIMGEDYPTPDGTCLRDYIHVCDLVTAHLLALERLLAGGGSAAYNLGTGEPQSVRAVIEAVGRAAGKPVPFTTAPRREGDPAALVASSALVRRELGWSPRYNDLDEIVATAWNWHLRSGA